MVNTKFKRLSNEIIRLVNQSQKILLHCHPGPDEDSVGSVLAMLSFLESLDKKVSIIKGDSPLPKQFYFLPGFQKIENKNFFEVDLNDFDLFIVLDSGAPDQISKLGKIAFPLNLKTICIDHHISNTGFCDINLIDSEAPATCQILHRLFKEWGVKMNHDIAVCLFLGIYSDTGGFRWPGTSSQTFLAAAELTTIAPDFSKFLSNIYSQREKDEIVFLGLGLRNTIPIFGNKAALATVSFKELTDNHINPESILVAELSTTLCSVKGWKIGIAMAEKEENVVRVSLRSKDGEEYDVSKIASMVGGGGHKAAAGALIKKPLQEAGAIVLDAITKIYPDL